MAEETLTRTKTVGEIFPESPAKDMLAELFPDFHPGFVDQTRDIATIFTPQSAQRMLSQLAGVEQLLTEADTYETTVKKFQSQIDLAESMRNELLAQVFSKIRPIEQSYRELLLFFENAKVPDGKVRQAPELYVFNADPKAIKNPVESMNIAAIEQFVRNRNDNFNFRDDICNLVVPGFLSQPVREKLEEIANAWGMLLIGDTDDEKRFRDVDRNFEPGGKYEFMKRPEDRAAADVVLTGYLQLRQAYSFEQGMEGGMYAPPSLVFAGALTRTDNSQGLVQGPVGSRFGQIVGVEKSRFEPLIGEMEHLSMERQLVPIIRDADNHLCFFGCRTQAHDPYGVYKFFTSYRILRYLERCCRHYLLQVAGRVLTREFMDEEIDRPLRRLLQEQMEQGTILGFDLNVDKDFQKRMQGVCEITLSVQPTGPAETFVLKLDVPDFKADSEKK